MLKTSSAPTAFLSLADWDDAGALRVRLTSLYEVPFLRPRESRLERRIVSKITRLTGLSASQVRDDARSAR